MNQTDKPGSFENDPDAIVFDAKENLPVSSGASLRGSDAVEPLPFALVAERLAAIQERHGQNAVGVYQGNPSVHNYGLMTHSNYFLGLLKTRSRFSATSVTSREEAPMNLLSAGVSYVSSSNSRLDAASDGLRSRTWVTAVRTRRSLSLTTTMCSGSTASRREASSREAAGGCRSP